MSCSSVDGWSLPRADGALAEALAAVVPHGISTGCRTIQSGDETLLLAEERQSIQTSYLKRLKASGAVRYIARGLLGEGHKRIPDFACAHWRAHLARGYCRIARP